MSRGAFFAFYGTNAGRGGDEKSVKIKIIQIFRSLKMLDANLN